MKNKNTPFFETALILAGELIVSAIVCAVYLLIQRFSYSQIFSYKVVSGVALGTAVTVLNFLFLSITTTRAFEKIRELRGTAQMDEEQALEFARQHQAELQNAVKLSFILRTFTMLGALVVAFLLDWFDVIATVIPLLMMRPIISVAALITSKKEAASASSKGIEVTGHIIDEDDTPSELVQKAEEPDSSDGEFDDSNKKAGDS